MSNKNKKILVVVESPNKVKTISNILKQAGYTKATVTASVGHIMILGDGGTAYNSGITPSKKFQMNLKVAADKQKIVSDIATKAEKADEIFLMTDGDREGELIAWSIIKFCNLPESKCVRAIAREITPKAIIAAIEHPTTLNQDLVNAGLVRMMSDKLIGYGLSPLGKKYIGAKSIGRCQSVGLKLVSDREKEINDFIPELYFELYLTFNKNQTAFKAKYCGYKTETITKFTKQADVDAVITNCANGDFTIESIKTALHSEAPSQPFCTATFQQEAANKLGLRVKDAMACAQKLFEGIAIDGTHVGLITYMRTDSTIIADEFLAELKQFVTETYGLGCYAGPRKPKKAQNSQEGHEALRVVNPALTPEKLKAVISNDLLLKVYALIWYRTVASVMSNATIEEFIYTISNNGHKFSFTQRQLRDLGFKCLENTAQRPAVCEFTEGEKLAQTELLAAKKFTQPVARYTEASLVRELQEKGIGRPSTYVTIVETILSHTRGYANLEEKRIIPTDRGIQLADYCNRAFPSLISLEYTKHMEDSLDKIAAGKLPWLDYMDNFYNHLQEVIKSTTETGIAPDMPDKICPLCGEAMIVRRSRFGRLFYGCSSYPKCRGIIGIE